MSARFVRTVTERSLIERGEERGTVPHYLAYKQTHLSADEASQLEQKLATKFPHREVDGDAVYVWRDV